MSATLPNSSMTNDFPVSPSMSKPSHLLCLLGYVNLHLLMCLHLVTYCVSHGVCTPATPDVSTHSHLLCPLGYVHLHLLMCLHLVSYCVSPCCMYTCISWCVYTQSPIVCLMVYVHLQLLMCLHIVTYCVPWGM